MDEDAGEFRLCLQIANPNSQGRAREQREHGHDAQDLHARTSFPYFLRVKYQPVKPLSNIANPSAARKSSAVPVAEAPNTASCFQPAGSSVETGTVFDCPPAFTATSSTANREVNCVTR